MLRPMCLTPLLEVGTEAQFIRHQVTVNGVNQYDGGFFALGLTRTPDIRLTALGLLCDYQPRLYSSDYNGDDSTRLVILQLGIVGGN